MKRKNLRKLKTKKAKMQKLKQKFWIVSIQFWCQVLCDQIWRNFTTWAAFQKSYANF